MTLAWILFAVFAALQAGDIVTTVANIRHQYATEGAPPERFLMHILGLVPALGLSKGAVVAVFGFALHAYSGRLPLLVLVVVADVGYGWVVFHNASIWLEHRRALGKPLL